MVHLKNEFNAPYSGLDLEPELVIEVEPVRYDPEHVWEVDCGYDSVRLLPDGQLVRFVSHFKPWEPWDPSVFDGKEFAKDSRNKDIDPRLLVEINKDRERRGIKPLPTREEFEARIKARFMFKGRREMRLLTDGTWQTVDDGITRPMELNEFDHISRASGVFDQVFCDRYLNPDRAKRGVAPIWTEADEYELREKERAEREAEEARQAIIREEQRYQSLVAEERSKFYSKLSDCGKCQRDAYRQVLGEYIEGIVTKILNERLKPSKSK